MTRSAEADRSQASLRGRAALITGASRGIGRACVLALAREGVDVTIAAKSAEERPNLPGTIHSVAREVEELGARALPVACDVRDREQIRAAVDATAKRFGRLDVLVCNAGALWWRPVLETPPKRFDLVMKVNFEHAFFACQAAVPHMLSAGWGHVVTMSPPVDPRWVPGHVAYCVSKFGMTMLAQGLAEELRGTNVAANALWPVTIIESQASLNWGLGDPSMWRTAAIVADALVAIVRHEPRELTGRALLDEPFLREQGVTDFSRYSVVPGSTPPPLDELWSSTGSGSGLRSSSSV